MCLATGTNVLTLASVEPQVLKEWLPDEGEALSLGAGAYHVDGPLTLPGIRLAGRGSGVKIVVAKDARILVTGGKTEISDVEFHVEGSESAVGLEVSGGEAVLKRCHFVGLGTGALLSGGTVVLEECSFEGLRLGVDVAGSAAPDIRECVFRENGAAGLSYRDDSGGRAVGNSVIDSRGNAVAVWGRAAPALEDNRLVGAANACITFFQSAGGDIRGNECSGSKVGIAVSGSGAPNLSRNKCRRCIRAAPRRR